MNLEALGISVAIGIVFGAVMYLVIKWFHMDDDK